MAELEFRDGSREVPDHLADLMRTFETHRMFYADAVAAANNKLVSDRLEKVQSDLIRDHFKQFTGRF